MRDLNETTVTAAVLEQMARTTDPRLRQIMDAAVRHLHDDLLELLEASVNGALNKVELKWSPTASVCVVMASGGYPGSYAKGKSISGLAQAGRLPNTKVFHAGTARTGEEILTNGGRVLGVTAWAKTLTDARASAYAAVERIQFEGAHFRRDIAVKALR